jgi:MOSC domain-containing protein YiiM/SAM-dependent methyltransferase
MVCHMVRRTSSDQPGGNPGEAPRAAAARGAGGMHPTAARGFAAGAEAYERSRPDYPAGAVGQIVRWLDLEPGRTVLELGAGTGKLTRMLIPSGAQILALEPVAEMREALIAVTNATPDVDAPVTLVGGTAEAIDLSAGSVDVVVVAQAFHWFDAIRALSEIHRVLRPGGRLLLAWNMRDESVPWVRALGERTRLLANDGDPEWNGGWRASLARCGLFGPWETRTFRHVQSLTRAGVRDRVASISFVAAASPAERAAVLAEIDMLLESDSDTRDRERIELPYETELMCAERRTLPPGEEGIVVSVNANDGGVPKAPVDGTRIGLRGLEGDSHHKPEPVHGGPDAAVCLYAQEAIERVRADGHQAFPGAYGENVTLLGIDWSVLGAGDRLAIGSDAEGPLLELTETATPCATQTRWFVGGRYGRISHKAHPEDARWYARVLREGPVAPSMAVRRIPHDD